jgi:hypothetical protein
LEGFGLFGAVLLFIVVFFIIFGAIRGYGMRVSNALPLGFVLFFISLWAICPNILNTLDEVFPFGNTILALIFLVSVIKIIAAFFLHSGSSLDAKVRELRGADFSPPEDPEIDREIAEDKDERKMLKKKTMRFTRVEIKSIDHIEECLKNIVWLIKERGNSLDQKDAGQIVGNLREISKNENILKKGMMIIRDHLKAYNALHRKDIGELEKRLNETKDVNKKKTIEEEIEYQKKMLDVIEFMKSYESKINMFTDTFNKLIMAAIQKVKGRYPNDALNFLEQAYKELLGMKSIFKKQMELEKYLLKLNKKTIADLKKEKGR